jgi:uncharacterized protein
MALPDLTVEVVYGTRDRQDLIKLTVLAGTSVIEAVQRSGMLDRFPELDIRELAMGIFGEPASADAVLREGDRVEIYRPLIKDPKDKRRERAKAHASGRR